MNLNSNSNHEQQQDVDVEMQNANVAQSAQKEQKLHNEIATHNLEKVKLQNIEMRIEKTIDEKMEKIRSQLDEKLNQMMNLIQPRTNTTIIIYGEESFNAISHPEYLIF